MKTVKALLNASNNKSMGNHGVKHIGTMRYFRYHESIICCVNDYTKQFSVDHHGWYTQSTSRAINSYIRELTNSGYTLTKVDGKEV